MNDDELVVQAKAILQDHGYQKPCHPLEALARRIQNTERNLSIKIFVYKWTGLSLLVLIPIISTVISLLVAGEKSLVAISPSKWLYGLSCTLTLLTVLNSIFRPSERFKEGCRMGVDFDLIRSYFLAELEEMSAVDEAHLHALVHKFDELVAPYQKELISMFLPEVAVDATKTAPHSDLTAVHGQQGQPAKTA
jgi:hypothetical protein